jgi:adenylate cyclase
MPRHSSEVALLLADITGSTPLYERIGDAAAVRQIRGCLDRLRAIADREGGRFVRSRGDDVLCTFAEPSSALSAAREMLAGHSGGSLAVHAGGHYGEIFQTREDLFGDAVNLTARLAALAKPGELLVSRRFFDQLPELDGCSFRVLDEMAVKGRNAPAEVYSLLAEDDGHAMRTEMVLGHQSKPRMLQSKLFVTLRHGEASRQCGDRQSLSIGRAPECHFVIAQPWISRKHATVSVRHGKVHLEDQSSAGTYVIMGNGQELFMHRESALLTGSGIISPAVRHTEPGAEVLHYEITRTGKT